MCRVLAGALIATTCLLSAATAVNVEAAAAPPVVKSVTDSSFLQSTELSDFLIANAHWAPLDFTRRPRGLCMGRLYPKQPVDDNFNIIYPLPTRNLQRRTQPAFKSMATQIGSQSRVKEHQRRSTTASTTTPAAAATQQIPTAERLAAAPPPHFTSTSSTTASSTTTTLSTTSAGSTTHSVTTQSPTLRSWLDASLRPLSTGEGALDSVMFARYRRDALQPPVRGFALPDELSAPRRFNGIGASSDVPVALDKTEKRLGDIFAGQARQAIERAIFRMWRVYKYAEMHQNDYVCVPRQQSVVAFITAALDDTARNATTSTTSSGFLEAHDAPSIEYIAESTLILGSVLVDIFNDVVVQPVGSALTTTGKARVGAARFRARGIERVGNQLKKTAVKISKTTAEIATETGGYGIVTYFQWWTAFWGGVWSVLKFLWSAVMWGVAAVQWMKENYLTVFAVIGGSCVALYVLYCICGKIVCKAVPIAPVLPAPSAPLEEILFTVQPVTMSRPPSAVEEPPAYQYFSQSDRRPYVERYTKAWERSYT